MFQRESIASDMSRSEHAKRIDMSFAIGADSSFFFFRRLNIVIHVVGIFYCEQKFRIIEKKAGANMRKSFRHIFHPQCESKLRENLNGFVDARKISIEMPLWKSRELISIRTDDNSRMRSFRKPNESSRGDEEEKSWIHYSAWCKKAFVMRLKTELRKKKGKVLLSSSLDQSQQSAERRNEVQSTEKLWIDKKKTQKVERTKVLFSDWKQTQFRLGQFIGRWFHLHARSTTDSGVIINSRELHFSQQHKGE